MCLCVCLLHIDICVLVLSFIICVHVSMFVNMLAAYLHLKHVQMRDKIRNVTNPFFVPAIFTVLTNDRQSKSLEATNAPVSKLTRSATHVSNNQATFQPLDSGDPSTLYSLSTLFLLLFSAACSSERSEQLTKTLYHKTLQFHSGHSIKVR